MQVGRVGPVRQHVLPAVDRLQQQEVGDLRDTRLARRGHPRGQRLAALVQHPRQLGDQAGQRRGGGTHQRRRDPSLIQDDAAIGGDLGHPRQADAQIAGALVGLQQVAQAQPADLQFGRLRRCRVRVVGLERPCGVAALGGAVGDLDRARLADRQRQVDQHVARAVRQFERRRMVGLAGQRERRAVLEHAGGGCEREAAGAEQVAIQRVVHQPPGMRPQRLHAAAHQLLRPAILLLEVLRAQEHALLPDHAVRPAHRSASPEAAFRTRSAGLQRDSKFADVECEFRRSAGRGRRVGAPLRVVDVAIQHDDANRLHAGLELECLGLRLARRQDKFL